MAAPRGYSWTQGTLWNAMDRTNVSYMQGKCLPLCSALALVLILLFACILASLAAMLGEGMQGQNLTESWDSPGTLCLPCCLPPQLPSLVPRGGCGASQVQTKTMQPWGDTSQHRAVDPLQEGSLPPHPAGWSFSWTGCPDLRVPTSPGRGQGRHSNRLNPRPRLHNRTPGSVCQLLLLSPLPLWPPVLSLREVQPSPSRQGAEPKGLWGLGSLLFYPGQSRDWEAVPGSLAGAGVQPAHFCFPQSAPYQRVQPEPGSAVSSLGPDKGSPHTLLLPSAAGVRLPRAQRKQGGRDRMCQPDGGERKGEGSGEKGRRKDGRGRRGEMRREEREGEGRGMKGKRK